MQAHIAGIPTGTIGGIGPAVRTVSVGRTVAGQADCPARVSWSLRNSGREAVS